ncbi:transcriptional regulator [Dehalobacter sp. DCM]|uniref:transcriptional regulator n=1 Tax=Dehalobacter sp. DCM TaxID=2907827 RepID=UPI003081FFC7|nr:transcriptional regulator [Dehalobacter sp. DCM]
MQFNEKLDFLMNITKTTNSALSIYTRIDASHISRLRKGQRGALKDITSINAMATYFASHCKEDYQRKAICDALDANPFNSEASELSALISRWLSGEVKNEVSTVGNFLSGFSNYTSRQSVPLFYVSEKIPKKNVPAVSIFYGVEGKKQAVIHFLTDVLTQGTPNTLLLFSDEPTDWMTADREFAMKWASLMFQILMKGNRIKIIHTVSRNLDEMLNAINQWMPLYMTGAIEPYFYPKKRDGIFKQTLFIAPNVSAVISRSVGHMLNQAANLFFKDKKAIKAYEEEYKQYLILCKPLMMIFTSKDEATYFHTLLEFEKEKSDSLIKTESLSLLTMPEAVTSSIISRLGKNGENLINYQKSRVILFEALLKTNIFSEIICLPDVTTVLASKVKVASSDMLSGGSAYYTPQEYVLHLERLVDLLKTYSNFHIYLTSEITEDRYTVYSKEDVGTIVAKTSTPSIILAMNENNMTAAFWDFLKHMTGDNSNRTPDKTETIKKMTSYILDLRKSMFDLSSRIDT